MSDFHVGTSGQTGLETSRFSLADLANIINAATISAKTKLSTITNAKSTIGIADMFDMQMLMNQLSQLSEASTAVVASANSAIQSMARNIKS